MHELIALLTSEDPAHRDTPFEAVCRGRDRSWTARGVAELERFVAEGANPFERVRAQLFRQALHRAGGEAERADELRQEAFATLTQQVRDTLRADPLHAPLFASPDPIRPARALEAPLRGAGVLCERTPVRMDFSHSGWSDIFLLAMDDPSRARVVNASIGLAPAGESPRPPVEARLHSIDEPVLRLVSEDLDARVALDSIPQVFDFGADALGLVRAGVVAGGLVPPGLEGATGPLAPLLESLAGPGRGIQLTTRVSHVPQGSRFGVSTALVACVIAVCGRACGEIAPLEGPLDDDARRRVAARAILGEWLGGSGGGWQDSGGLWPGIKRIEAVAAAPGDPEYGVSRGRLLPEHTPVAVSPETVAQMAGSLVLVHGALAQDAGPILQDVTEHYLLRQQPAWSGREQAARIYDELIAALGAGDVRGVARATDRNFHGPLTTILPRAASPYVAAAIERVASELGPDYWGFWMLGGSSGGGMGFWIDPAQRDAGADRIHAALLASQREHRDRLPFAGEPLLYDYAIDERGSTATLVEHG